MADEPAVPTGGRLPPLNTDGDAPKKRRRRKPREPADTAAENAGFQGDETGASETPAAPGRRRRRRRDREEPAAEDAETASAAPTEATEATEATEGETPAETKRKRRPRKRPQPEGQEEEQSAPREAPVGIGEELADLGDDVKVEGGEEGHEEEDEVDAVVGGGQVLKSEPAENFYIEGKRGLFRSERRGHWEARVAAERERALAAANQEEPDTGNATLKFALSVNKCFRVFTLFVICLFSGICLWNTLVINLYYGDSPWDEFYSNISSFSLPMTLFFNIALILCCVSVMDRYDWGRPSRRFCRECATCKTGAFCVIFFFIAYIAHNALYSVDRLMYLYGINDTIKQLAANSSALQPARKELWKVCDIIRTVAVVLGAFVVLMTPTYDALHVNLQTDIEEDMMDDENRELLDIRAGSKA